VGLALTRAACAAALACLVAAPASVPSAEPGDAASSEAKEDVSLLVAHGVAYARNALRGGVGLSPYAFVMRADGGVQRVSAPGGDEMAPDALLEALRAAFRGRAEEGVYRAVALFADVVIAAPGGGETDAVHAGAEHRAGYCRNVYHPYRRTADGGLEFEAPLTTARRAEIFTRCD
jgi:hypothetical protein